jgi:glycosyltransferase involved in cell wall biosynthesis
MRIAFVVQRYGTEVNGGAEWAARLLAERLSPYVQIEVLTTCAVNYMTWENHYAPGVERINGVPVRRFAIHSPRNVEMFNQFSATLMAGDHSYYDEIQWMALQGPDTPDLFNYIQTQQDDYDLFVFFTYLYTTTYIGLQLVPHKSLLLPTAHDEPWIHLKIFQSLFHLPRGFIFLTHEEEKFVRAHFRNRHIPGVIAGIGIDPPQIPSIATLPDDYVLYLGRVDESKGCGELFRYFLRYKEETGDPLKLVLVGSQAMAIPQHPDIIPLGFLAGDDHWAWLRDAQILIMPSPYESFSFVTLEAWMVETPVLMNGQSEVLKGHAHRSHGGIYYHNQEEFIESLCWLRREREQAQILGQQGREYVMQHYQWPQVSRQYITFFSELYKHLE